MSRYVLQRISVQMPPLVQCPVCQQGHMLLVQTLYRQPAVWDLAAPMPRLDTS